VTKAEIRRERERLERAFRYVQHRLGWTLDITLECSGAVSLLSVRPSERGVEDPVCFVVEFNPDTLSALSLSEVRSSAFHELLHGKMWPFWEAATSSVPSKVREHLLKRYWEPLVYDLERSVWPWVGGG